LKTSETTTEKRCHGYEKAYTLLILAIINANEIVVVATEKFGQFKTLLIFNNLVVQ